MSNFHQRLLSLQHSWENLWNRELWEPMPKGPKTPKWYGLLLLRFFVLLITSFQQNRGPSRAAALTYVTLLAIVPLLFVSLSLSKIYFKGRSEEISNVLLNQAIRTIAPQLRYFLEVKDQTTAQDVTDESQIQISDEGRQKVLNAINGFLQRIDAGSLGGLGTFLLIVASISLLHTIEITFNDMWGIQSGRAWVKKIVYYWASITLVPLLVFMAFAITGSIGFLSMDASVAQKITWYQSIFLHLFPFLIIWCTLSLFYAFMPNTRVPLHAAIAGGVIGGTLWQLNNLFSVIYASRAVTYSKLYGSLGLVLIFLVGLYFSWMIILLGAQVAYIVQNFHRFNSEKSKSLEDLNLRSRELTTLRCLYLIGKNFIEGHAGPTAQELSNITEIPTKLINEVVCQLTDLGYVTEVNRENDTAYQPAKPPESILLSEVLLRMRNELGDEVQMKNDSFMPVLESEEKKVEEAISDALKNVSLRGLYLRHQSA